MARKSLPSKDKSHNALSADEFQKQLLNWFQDRGLLTDLQAHLRHQMIVALRDTSLHIHSVGSLHQAGSPKLQAINLLVAEFLLRQQCHYTLSVFTSEVPLLRNLPEFSSVSPTVGIENSSHEDGFPGFHERDVFDILEAVGFSIDSDESKLINDLYENSQGESLLTCIIRSLPIKKQSDKKDKSPLSCPDSKKDLKEAALQQCMLFTEDVCMLVQQSNLEVDQISLLHNAVKRIVEEEVEKVKKNEAARFRQELIDREQRIQAVWSRHDLELQEVQRKSDEKLNDERRKLKDQLKRKETQFVLLASKLKEQQQDIACRLNYAQERSDLIDRKEAELNILKKESEDSLVQRQEEINSKEKLLEEQMSRLEAETKAREEEKKELQANRLEIEAVSKVIKESQSELVLLREMQKQHSIQIEMAQKSLYSSETTDVSKKKLEVSAKKKKIECISQGVQVDINKAKGAVPKKSNSHQQTNNVSQENQLLQTQISASDLEDVFLQLHQQAAESERQRSQHTMLGNLVDQLQQENTELRGHIEQQRIRIHELTTQMSEYMKQLSQTRSTITRLRNRPNSSERNHYGVQTSPRSSIDAPPAAVAGPSSTVAASAVPPVISVMDSVPGLALGAYGYHSPPAVPPQPRPPPEARPPSRGFVRSSQVGAGEESYFSRRLPPESFVPLYTSPNHREQRRKPPRRLMVHSVSSSDDSCPSPTEEMLREARRRLRRLEEESAAIDRSYQQFRLRNTDSVVNTASILFQPIPLARDYNVNFSLPVPQNAVPRNVMQNTSVFPVPSSCNRSRSYVSWAGLLNQFPSTTNLQTGTLQPIPTFPLPRGNDQVRQSFSFTSSQTHYGQTITSLYSAPTDLFSSRVNTQGGVVTTSALHGPPLSSSRVQHDVSNPSVSGGTRGETELPTGFNTIEQSRYSEERVKFQPVNQQDKACSSRWLQNLPPCTSSVPYMPLAPTQNASLINGSSSLDKADIVFIRQDNELAKTQLESSTESSNHPVGVAAANDSQTFKMNRNISLQSASDENIGEHILSSPLRIPTSSENVPSELHSTRSSTDLNEINNLQLNKITAAKESELQSKVHDACNDSSSVDIPLSLKQPTTLSECNSSSKNADQCSVPGGRSSKKSSPKESDNSSHTFSQASEKDGTTRETNSDNKGTLKETKESELSQENGTKSYKNIHNNVVNSEIIIDSNRDSQIIVDEIKSELSSENEKPKSDLDQQIDFDEASNIPPENFNRISNTGNSVEQESQSPSLPSTLGSSNELGSDIVSVGEDKEDDSW